MFFKFFFKFKCVLNCLTCVPHDIFEIGGFKAKIHFFSPFHLGEVNIWVKNDVNPEN